MKQVFSDIVEKNRKRMGPFRSYPGERQGWVEIPHRGKVLRCMFCADAEGWDHVSVSTGGSKYPPTWDDMCYIKDLFFEESECVVQFHPAKSDHINIHKRCLHLWRKVDDVFPMPPREFV